MDLGAAWFLQFRDMGVGLSPVRVLMVLTERSRRMACEVCLGPVV